MFEHNRWKLRTQFENQILCLLVKMKKETFSLGDGTLWKMRLALCIGKEMDGRLVMSLCCGWQCWSFLFKGLELQLLPFSTSHDVSALCASLSLSVDQIWLTKAVSDWCSAFLFLYDEYVCASTHVFLVYTVDIKCVNVYESLALHFFLTL